MKDDLESKLSRRSLLKQSSALALVLAGSTIISRNVEADSKLTSEAIKKIVGTKTLTQGKVSISAPQIAENGNTVPFSIEIDSPMTTADHVKSVHVFADGNPRPEVASFHFRPGSVAKVSSRMRMIKTQNIIAVAETSGGSIYSNKVKVKVTIGGCGG